MGSLIMGLHLTTCFLFFFLGFSNIKALEEKVCLDGWIQATYVDLGCLLINQSSVVVDWEDANVACQAFENGRLVEIQTEEQFQFLQMELDVVDVGGSDWWTGGQLDVDGEFNSRTGICISPKRTKWRRIAYF